MYLHAVAVSVQHFAHISFIFLRFRYIVYLEQELKKRETSLKESNLRQLTIDITDDDDVVVLNTIEKSKSGESKAKRKSPTESGEEDCFDGADFKVGYEMFVQVFAIKHVSVTRSFPLHKTQRQRADSLVPRTPYKLESSESEVNGTFRYCDIDSQEIMDLLRSDEFRASLTPSSSLSQVRDTRRATPLRWTDTLEGVEEIKAVMEDVDARKGGNHLSASDPLYGVLSPAWSPYTLDKEGGEGSGNGSGSGNSRGSGSGSGSGSGNNPNGSSSSSNGADDNNFEEYIFKDEPHWEEDV